MIEDLQTIYLNRNIVLNTKEIFMQIDEVMFGIGVQQSDMKKNTDKFYLIATINININLRILCYNPL